MSYELFNIAFFCSVVFGRICFPLEMMQERNLGACPDFKSRSPSYFRFSLEGQRAMLIFTNIHPVSPLQSKGNTLSIYLLLTATTIALNAISAVLA